MGLICLNNVEGIGERCVKGNGLTVNKGVFLTKPDFEFATFASFATQADWLTAIAAGNIFPVLDIQEIEPQPVADGVYQSPTGEKTDTFKGMRGYILKLNYDLKSHKILKTYAGRNWRIFKFDSNNNIKGTTPDGTKVKGFKVGYLKVFDQDDAESGKPAFTRVEIQESDPKEWDGDDNGSIYGGVYVTPTWLAADLRGVLTVKAVPSVVAAFAFTVQVNYEDGSYLTAAGAKRTAAISGLLAANFRVIDQTGAVEVCEVAESAATSGLYTVTGVDITTGSVQVVPSSTMLFKSAVVALTA